MALLHLKILTPKGSFFEGDVEYINFYNSVGKIEILPRHIAYMSDIEPSVFEIKKDNILKRIAVTGGIIDFRENEAYVLAETAEWPDDIDNERAQNAYERARIRMKSRDPKIDTKRAESALLRASARLKCVKYRNNSGSTV